MSSVLVDAEVARRIHRDLLTTTEPPHGKELEQLRIGGGGQSGIKIETFGPSHSIDDELRNLRADWERLQEKRTLASRAWETPKQLHRQSETPSYTSDAEKEIEYLRRELERYQRADPALDFVHKDVYQKVLSQLNEGRESWRQAMNERDQVVKELAAAKAYNSAAEADKKATEAQLQKAIMGINAMNKQLVDKEAEINKHQLIETALENQLAEFRRRYETIDNHLMELGEQKTAFLEGIRERQAQLDFATAQLQFTQETLVKAERERQLFQNKAENAESELKTVRNENQSLKGEIRQTVSKLNENEKNLASTTQQVVQLNQLNQSQKDLSEKISAALLATTEEFERFIKEVALKESDWSACIGEAWKELQAFKQTQGAVGRPLPLQQIRSTPGSVNFQSPQKEIGFQPAPAIQKEKDGSTSKSPQNESSSKPSPVLFRQLPGEFGSQNAAGLKPKGEISADFEKFVNDARLKEQELRRTVDKAEKELEVLKKARAELTKIGQEHEQEGKRLKGVVDKMQEEAKVLNSKNKTLEEQVTQLDKAQKKLEDEIKEKNDELEALQTKLRDKQLELLKSRARETGTKQGLASRRAGVGWAPENKVPPEIDMLKRKPLQLTRMKTRTILPFQQPHKPQTRFVQLTKNGEVLNIWKSAPAGSTPPDERVQLSEVLRTEYGIKSSAAAWRKAANVDVVPWRCFSIYVAENSYDFVCSNDQDTECLVLGFNNSVAKYNATGIRARHELVFRRGKMKLQNYCKKNNITMKQLLLSAIKITKPSAASAREKPKAAAPKGGKVVEPVAQKPGDVKKADPKMKEVKKVEPVSQKPGEVKKVEPASPKSKESKKEGSQKPGEIKKAEPASGKLKESAKVQPVAQKPGEVKKVQAASPKLKESKKEVSQKSGEIKKAEPATGKLKESAKAEPVSLKPGEVKKVGPASPQSKKVGPTAQKPGEIKKAEPIAGKSTKVEPVSKKPGEVKKVVAGSSKVKKVAPTAQKAGGAKASTTSATQKAKMGK